MNDPGALVRMFCRNEITDPKREPPGEARVTRRTLPVGERVG